MKEGHVFAMFIESKLDKFQKETHIGYCVRHYDLSEITLDKGNTNLYASCIMLDRGDGWLDDECRKRIKELLFEDEGKGGIVMEDSEEVSFIDQNDETILIISSIQ